MARSLLGAAGAEAGGAGVRNESASDQADMGVLSDLANLSQRVCMT